MRLICPSRPRALSPAAMAYPSPTPARQAGRPARARRGFTRDPAELAPWLTDWRGRYHGAAAALLSPATREEAAEIVRLCAAEGVPLVPQGGNTSMVGGATPDASGAALIALDAADEPDPRARRGRGDRGLRGRRDPRRPARGGAGRGAALSADARRQGLGDDRRPGLDQCRRHPGAALRHDARAGARDRGGAARRQPVRRADRAQEGQSRLRPQAAADRRRRARSASSPRRA